MNNYDYCETTAVDVTGSLIRNKKTMLPNSEMFKLRLRQRLESDNAVDFSVFAVEIINLNEINRYIDFNIGIEAIRYVIDEMKKYFRGCEIFSVYTNEIAVILDDATVWKTTEMGNEILRKINNLIEIKGKPIHIESKAGIVNYPLHGQTADELYQNMGRSLSQGITKNSVSVYSREISQRRMEQKQIGWQLYHAIQKDELRLVYQPILNIKHNRIDKVEALLRWDQSDLNIAEVIEIAEKSNLINQLTIWVVEEVFKQHNCWLEEGMDLGISINISPRSLRNRFLFDEIKRLINKYDINPEYIDLELTERTMYLEDDGISDLLGEIRKYGLKVAIDDHGTGYNTFKNSTLLPSDIIKLDKYLIDNIDTQGCYTMLKGIIQAANARSNTVIAEGVENYKQLVMLRNIGCEMIQGYYVSKPVLPSMLVDFIRQESPKYCSSASESRIRVYRSKLGERIEYKSSE